MSTKGNTSTVLSPEAAVDAAAAARDLAQAHLQLTLSLQKFGNLFAIPSTSSSHRAPSTRSFSSRKPR